jgi:hypothetical protein
MISFEDKLNVIVDASLGGPICEAESRPDAPDVGRLADRRTRASKDWTQYVKGMKYIEQVRNAAKTTGLGGEFRKVVMAVFAGTRPNGESVKDKPPSLIEVHQILLGLRKGLIEKLNQRQHGMGQNIDQEDLPPNVLHAVEVLKKEILSNPQHVGLSDLLNPRDVAADATIIYKVKDHEEGEPKEVKVKLDNSMGLEKLINIFGRALKQTGRVDELMPKFKATLDARKTVLAHFQPEDTEDQRMHTALLYSFRTILDELYYLESREDDGSNDGKWSTTDAALGTRLSGPAESKIKGRLNATSRGIASLRHVYK